MMNHLSRFPGQLLFLFLGMCTLLVFAAPITTLAATYYVATTGSDSNPGTESQPFKSFARGVSMLQPGDTLYIRGGIWTEQMKLSKITGTPGNYITIAGYPGERPIIRYADPIENGNGAISARGNRGYFIFENLVIDGVHSSKFTGWQIRDGNHHFILRNLEIMNQKYNGVFVLADDVQIINCKLHDATPATPPGGGGSYYYGIYYSGGNNILIEGNEIYHNSGGGMQIYPGPISNAVIRNNYVHDNSYASNTSVGGILVWGKLLGGGPITKTQVYNNVVYNNGSAPGSGKATGITIGLLNKGTKVWNNTVFGNNRYGMLIGFDSSVVDTVVQNNISYGNASGNYVGSGVNTIYTNNFTTDPDFVDTSAFNFSLRARSEAIGKGLCIAEVRTDIRNAPRPQPEEGGKCDIGAYQTSEPPAINAPRNLKAM